MNKDFILCFGQPGIGLTKTQKYLTHIAAIQT